MAILTHSLNSLLSTPESKSTKTSHLLPNKAPTIQCSSLTCISPSLWMHDVDSRTHHWVPAHITDCWDKLGPYKASGSHEYCETINCSANWKLKLASKRNPNLLDYKYSCYLSVTSCWVRKEIWGKGNSVPVNKCLLQMMGSKPYWAIELLIILLEGSRFSHQQEKEGRNVSWC